MKYFWSTTSTDVVTLVDLYVQHWIKEHWTIYKYWTMWLFERRSRQGPVGRLHGAVSKGEDSAASQTWRIDPGATSRSGTRHSSRRHLSRLSLRMYRRSVSQSFIQSVIQSLFFLSIVRLLVNESPRESIPSDPTTSFSGKEFHFFKFLFSIRFGREAGRRQE